MNPVRALLAISLGCASGVVLAQSRPATLSAVVGRYCLSCHNSRLAEGSVSFDALDAEHPWAEAEAWERVLRQLRAGTMPPTDTPRPDRKTYDALVAWLGSALDQGDARKTAAASRRLTDREWASRLASLLWSAAPDAALVDAARRGRLQDPAVVEQQVQRMLADARIAGLVGSFFAAWLGLDQLGTMAADSAAFPEFDAELRQQMRRETELFLESQLREDRPAVELWTAGYTYLTDRLARH
ncbi:MAG: DUF1592 domain-containing protein [Acidobacteriia bacterium]|nr:DUF1592 domain-containing protein [Terriglobia bacterium]